jgi:hypothetical protein
MATEVGPGSATTDTRPAAPAAVRWGAWAGIAYVLAWLIGLFLAPSAPDLFGSAVTINAYFSAHRPAAMIQSVFIHGLAGVALLGLTAALWSYLAATETAGPRRVMLAAGVLAAAVSFLQVAFMIAIYVHVGQQGSTTGTRTVFNAIDKADTIKLILLAVFVGAASWAASRNGALARWGGLAWRGDRCVPGGGRAGIRGQIGGPEPGPGCLTAAAAAMGGRRQHQHDLARTGGPKVSCPPWRGVVPC